MDDSTCSKSISIFNVHTTLFFEIQNFNLDVSLKKN